MAGITIGPFSFPAGLLVACCALAAALFAGNAAAGTARARAEQLLWAVLGMATLAARAAFVARHWNAYAAAPVQALDIRDGGFDALAGVAAGLALASWLAWRNQAQRKPLAAGTLAGTVVLAAGLALVASTQRGQELPAIALPALDGGSADLRAFSGRPVVLNLWASWCPPCRREMPVLAQAQRSHPGTAFVFVNQRESAEAVRAYLREHGLALQNVLLDQESRVGQATGSPGLPTTLFFDARGRLAERRMGELSRATLDARLDAIERDAPASAHGVTNPTVSKSLE